jgi:hypothetical protein
MYCPKCGKENNEEAAFCRYCGASLATTQNSAENSSPAAPMSQNMEPQEIPVPKPKKVATVDEKPQKEIPVSKKQTLAKKGRRKWIALVTVVVLLLGGAGYFLFATQGGIGSTGSTTIPEPDYSLIPVKQGNAWGYINPKGEYVINPQFENAGLFYDGLARVTVAGKTGLINTNGEYVVNPEYQTIGMFYDGLARVQRDLGGEVGYIDKSGDLVIKPIYKDGSHFSEGLAFVVPVGGQPTCIGTDGGTRFVLENAKWVYSFDQGNEDLACFGENYIIQAGEKYGYVDKTGKISYKQADSIMTWSDVKYTKNVKFVHGEGLVPLYLDGKWGYKNAEGKMVITPQFDRAEDFCEGLAGIVLNSKLGFIDEKGNIIISPQFDPGPRMHYFVNNMIIVGKNGKFGFIDKKGNFIINPQFDGVRTGESALDLGTVSTRQFIFAEMYNDERNDYSIEYVYDRSNPTDENYNNFPLLYTDHFDITPIIQELFSYTTDSVWDAFGSPSEMTAFSNHPHWNQYLTDASAHDTVWISFVDDATFVGYRNKGKIQIDGFESGDPSKWIKIPWVQYIIGSLDCMNPNFERLAEAEFFDRLMTIPHASHFTTSQNFSGHALFNNGIFVDVMCVEKPIQLAMYLQNGGKLEHPEDARTILLRNLLKEYYKQR